MPRTASLFAFFCELAAQQAENKYTDDQLAELMTEQHPNFKGAHMIPAYRNDYNKGARPAVAPVPDVPLCRYDAEGNEIAPGKRKAAKAPKTKGAAVNKDDEVEVEVEETKPVKCKAKAAPAKAPLKLVTKGKPAKKK
jgi:hypothetical protein